MIDMSSFVVKQLPHIDERTAIAEAPARQPGRCLSHIRQYSLLPVEHIHCSSGRERPVCRTVAPSHHHSPPSIPFKNDPYSLHVRRIRHSTFNGTVQKSVQSTDAPQFVLSVAKIFSASLAIR